MDSTNLDQSFMRKAEELKTTCNPQDGPPQTALLVKGNSIVSTGRNCRISSADPIRYAEMDCMASAGRRNDHETLTLYTTGTPNWLVAGTVIQFGVGTVVYGGNPQAAPVEFLKSKGVTLRHWGLT